eukprot:350486-Chlamydomonas_euryale.AAC.9
MTARGEKALAGAARAEHWAAKVEGAGLGAPAAPATPPPPTHFVSDPRSSLHPPRVGALPLPRPRAPFSATSHISAFANESGRANECFLQYTGILRVQHTLAPPRGGHRPLAEDDTRDCAAQLPPYFCWPKWTTALMYCWHERKTALMSCLTLHARCESGTGA